MSTPAIVVSLAPAPSAHAIALGMVAGKRYRPNYLISDDGLTMTFQMVEMPSAACITYDVNGNPIIVPPPLTDPTAFDAAGVASSLVATEAAARASADATLTANLAALTTGSPSSLDTFLEAYNRFLTDETAASALTAALATETNNRTTGDATNATAITAESSARAAAVTTLTTAIAAKQNAGNETTAILDFGFASGNEGDTTTLTVSASWVTTSSRIICLPSPAGSADHSYDETAVEDIHFSAVNIVNGVSFDIQAVAPNGTWGRHNCSVVAF